MTKKSGLYDVDFGLSTTELTASIKGEKVPTVLYKPFDEAVATIIKQKGSPLVPINEATLLPLIKHLSNSHQTIFLTIRYYEELVY